MLEKKYKYLAIYFIILQILIIYRNYILDDLILIFYFCNHIAILLAFGFFTKNFQLIKGLINIGLIPQLIYAIEFFSEIIFKTNLISSTGDLHTYSTITFIITLFIHFTTLFIAFYFVKNIKITKQSLIYSFSYILILYFTTILFTPIEYDLNCVYNACEISFLQFNNFIYLWIPITILFTIIPTYYIQKIIFNKEK
jgi:hypothetical protein